MGCNHFDGKSSQYIELRENYKNIWLEIVAAGTKN
jgi:hypothetical protein